MNPDHSSTSYRYAFSLNSWYKVETYSSWKTMNHSSPAPIYVDMLNGATYKL